MNSNKILSVFALSILLLAVVSAAVGLVVPSTVKFTQSETAKQFIVTTSTTSNFSAQTNPPIANNAVKFTVSGVSSNDNSATYSVTATPVSGTFADLEFGTYSTTTQITAMDAVNASNFETKPVTLEFVKSFCTAGPVGNLTTGKLEITDIDINSDGDDDDVWQPLDEVDIDVEISNPTDEDVDDVIVEMGLFDSAGNNVADDLDFSSADEEEADLGKINDDDDETATFSFTVPADFDDGSYTLVFKTYSDGDEDTICADNGAGESIDVEREEDEEKFIVVDNIQVDSQATCGETVSGSFDLVNVGDEDQDQVLVTLTNTELNLNEEIEITDDLDEGDLKHVSFSFDVPQDAVDKTYLLKFRTFYDYDDGNYDQESEDTFDTSFKVIGCGSTPGSDSGNDQGLSIDAELDSDAVAGQEMQVTATISNDGDSSATIGVEVTGYNSWAELESVSPRLITLDAGESREVTITFTVDADASGTQSFSIEADNDGQTESRDVEVTIKSTSSSNGLGGLFSGNSSLIWVIGLINLILIILIIVVAIRLSRK